MLYEAYFLQRLLEELELAQGSKDPAKRSVHERACHYYGEMLHLLHHSRVEKYPKVRP